MAKLTEIMSFIDRQFAIGDFSDVSLNGLQFEGSAEVTKIACAVDTGIEVVEKCIASGAQLLLVHHGIFWGSPHAVVGPWRKLYKTILEHEISVVALHLPLDAHPVYGNNHLLGQFLGLGQITPAANYKGRPIGCIGNNQQGLTLKAMSEKLGQLGQNKDSVLSLEFGPEIPQRVCIVSGSAADQLYNYAEEGFDTLVSGEPKQFAYHFCQDHQLNAVFAGHYATETVGVRALAKALAESFKINWEFLDIPTGI